MREHIREKNPIHFKETQRKETKEREREERERERELVLENNWMYYFIWRTTHMNMEGRLRRTKELLSTNGPLLHACVRAAMIC